MWDVSDEALVAGVAAGDPDVAAVFVHRFQHCVYGLALAFTREPVVSPHDDLVPILDELRALPAEQRETLMAAAYFGFTAREISAAWGVPIGTVKTRLRSALGRLRDVLAGVPA